MGKIMLITACVILISTAAYASLPLTEVEKGRPAFPLKLTDEIDANKDAFSLDFSAGQNLLMAQNQKKGKKASKKKSYYPGYAKKEKMKKSSKIWKFQTNRPGGNTRALGNTKWKDYKLLYQYTRDLGQPAWVHPANRK